MASSRRIAPAFASRFGDPGRGGTALQSFRTRWSAAIGRSALASSSASRDRGLVRSRRCAGAPRSVRNALQVMVSGLRRVLATGAGGELARVVTRAPGYLLEVEPDHVDLHRFTGLVAASRHERDDARRARLLREALGLWRGS